MRESRMTLHVYRLAPDGTRTDLGRQAIRADEPYGSLLDIDPPCRCSKCLREREQEDPDEAA